MATYGNVGEFKESEESWTQYAERLEQYFAANEIKDEKKQRAILLSVCGSKTYRLIRDLLQPKKPGDADLKEISEKLESHFSPKPSVIVERFKFHSRNRLERENVAEFVAGLKRVSEHCQFGTTLEDMLRDRLVCGISDDRIQRRLLAERELTFEKAVAIATATEMASKNLIDIGGKTPSSDTNVNKVEEEIKPPHFQRKQECYRCSGNHDPSSCKFKNEVCYKCQKKGHMAKVCRGKKKPPKQGKSGRRPDGKQRTHFVEENADQDDVYAMYHLSGDRKKSFKVDLELCGRKNTMEIDTGASKTILNEATYGRLRDVLGPLQTTKAVLSTYTGEKIPVLGAVMVPVKYGSQQKKLNALIVEGGGPNLLGRDWLEELRLDWETIFQIASANPRSALHEALSKYQDVFAEGLGTLKGVKAKIYVDQNAEPKYIKARAVPYALRTNVELELERLEREGIISPVEFSEWAAPIVPVAKPNGTVRICGDYKLTVNQVSKLDNYPIPKTEDLLATLGGGEKFTKLDMSQAYQQMTLDEESRKFTTINTHKGLFQYNRLPFGVSSAPGIFQRTMENLLQGIPQVIVRMDDILISGKDDNNHIANLEAVLKKLSEAGLRLRKEKCFFMVSEVTYCGYEINGQGIKPVEAKVEAIQNAPVPENVTQLRAFLGMLNYYHRFLPDIATVLEPLHKLLRQGTKWCWKTEQQVAFDKSKKLLQSANLLVHFQPDLELILASDASDYGVGAVLSHRMADGTERPIGYVSRSLNTAERGYSTIEKEALAIIFGVKKFNQFLYGHKFTIQTDHKPLEGLFNEKKGVPQQASPRVQRWALTLAAYEYKIAYKAGTTNGNADALSRLPLSNMPESVPVPGETVLLLEHLDHTPINSRHIQEWTRRDPVLSKVHQFTLNGWPHHCQDVQLHPYFSRKAELTIESGCVLWGNRVIVPPQGRAKVIAELHEAHPGISRMKALARGYVWWPNMDRELEEAVKRCQQCQLHQKAPAEAPLHPWEWPGQPWARVHIDYAGPLKGHMYLVVIDAHSKWMDVHLMCSTTSAATIAKLREIFATHGLPETIVSDNGPNFTSAEFENFLSKNGVKHTKVSPYHPASNGQAERAVRAFKEGIGKMEEGTIQDKLSRFLLKYRTTPHTTTGVTPAELLMKRKLRTKLDLLVPNTARLVRQKQEHQKQTHDHHAKHRDFEANDPVFIKDFSSPKSWQKGTVVHTTGPVSALVELPDGRVVRRHQDHMQRSHSTDPTKSNPEIVVPGVVPGTDCTTDATQLSGPPKPVVSSTDAQEAKPSRPVRDRRLPERLKDYEL